MTKLSANDLWLLPSDQLGRRLKLNSASARALEELQRRRDSLMLTGREPLPPRDTGDPTTSTLDYFDFGGS